MTDPYDSDLARQTFAVDRSQKDAESSTATARSTAQAAILINGGAATAVLAFLAKEKLDPLVLKIASICLAGYALGVVVGACMMFCSVRSLEHYSSRWRLTAHPEEGKVAESYRKAAFRWLNGMRYCFYLSMMAFACSSIALAGVLFYSNLSR